MKRWAVSRSAVINTLVTVALVTIFSTGSAAAALIVKSVNIVDGEVKTVDLANAAVTTAKLAPDAVTGAKVNESTLGIVPNANLLDGRDSTSFVSGPGRVLSGFMPNAWNDGTYIFLSSLASEIGFNVIGHCGLNDFWLTNQSSGPWDVWIQIDGDYPVCGQAGAAGNYPADTVKAVASTQPPHVATIHAVQSSTGRQAVIEMSTRGIPPPGSDGYGNCYDYAVATLNY